MPLAVGVGDDGGVIPPGQQHHVGGSPRGERGHLAQVRQWPHPNRGRSGPSGQSLGEQDFPVRRDHDAGAAGLRIPGTDGQCGGGTLIGAQPGRLPRGIGPRRLPCLLRLGGRLRHRDHGRHDEVGRRHARPEGTQPRGQFSVGPA